MNKIHVAIVGGAGYTGGELIRLLLHHPHASLLWVHSRNHAGKPVHHIHTDLAGDTDLLFSDDLTVLRDGSIDVLFLCLGHGEAKKFLEATSIDSKVKIIDLSHDFRLQQSSMSGERQFVYGLPEVNKNKIKAAHNIANPGCFATAIQLGILPLAKAGMLQEVYTTGITGSTGAGQSLSATSHFSWRANNIQAYKTLTHQHISEISETVAGVAGDRMQKFDIHFVPWRGDFTRGIFVSSTVASEMQIPDLFELYHDFYKDAPFTIVSRNELSLKQVVNTNKCIIHLERAGSKLVVHSAIDNLLKGASGQAVQNMNLMCGFDESDGLLLKASAF